MIDVFKKLKLYRILTVIKYIPLSWNNSALVQRKYPNKNRICITWDLVYCFLVYGADFNDYCTFDFSTKNKSERDTYISLRRNDVLRFKLSTLRVHQLFLDKAAFNIRFSKYINRQWMVPSKHESENLINFIKTHETVVVKPLDDYGGHGIVKINLHDKEFENKMFLLEKRIDNGEKLIIEEAIDNCNYLKKLPLIH